MTHRVFSRCVPSRPRPGRGRLFRCAAALGAACAAVGGARAQAPLSGAERPRFVLLDSSLKGSVVQLVAIRRAGQQVVVIDTAGTETVRPMTDVAALVPAWWSPPTEGGVSEQPPLMAVRPPGDGNSGVIELTDGQRYSGHPGHADQPGADAVVWVHPIFGAMSIPMDEVRSIVLRPVNGGNGAPKAAPAADGGKPQDRVVTVNGDVVTGFVESVDAAVRVDSGGKPIDVPLEQVSQVAFQNAPRRPDPLMRFWLADGTIASAARFAQADQNGNVTFEVAAPEPVAAPSAAKKKPGAGATPAKPQPSEAALTAPSRGASSISLSYVTALVSDASRLVPLAKLAVQSQQAVGGRRRFDPLRATWADAPVDSTGAAVLDAPDLLLPGPMMVEWVLPQQATRLAGWAELARDSLVWGDCVLSIGVVGGGQEYRELFTQRVNGQHPTADFNIALPGGTGARLRVTLDPGEHGPIQDRVLLRRGLILTGGGR